MRRRFCWLLIVALTATAGCGGERAGTFKGKDRPQPPPVEKK